MNRNVAKTLRVDVDRAAARRVVTRAGEGNRHDVNMVVPINLLKPVLTELQQFGRPQRPPRPWLGMYTIENQERLVVAGVSDGGPAQKAGLRVGDIVSAVAGEQVSTLAAKALEESRIGLSPLEKSTRYVRFDRRGPDGKYLYYRAREVEHPVYERAMESLSI